MSIVERARRTLLCAAFGLPIALEAHMLVFGRSHELAGNLHALFVDLALGITCALIAALLAGSLSSDPSAVQGTIFARRIRACTPSLLSMAMSAAAWLTAVESCERTPHAIPIVPLAAALLVCAALASTILRFVTSAISDVVLALRMCLLSGDAKAWKNLPIAATIPAMRTRAHRYRTFSRPPPRFA